MEPFSRLTIRASTTTCGGREIFDYESTKLAKLELTCYSNGFLFRKRIRVFSGRSPTLYYQKMACFSRLGNLTPRSTILGTNSVFWLILMLPTIAVPLFFRLPVCFPIMTLFSTETYAVMPASDPKSKLHCESLWLVIRTLEPVKTSPLPCKLFLGDKIKLGRQEFKILELQGPTVHCEELLPKLYVTHIF